MVMSRAGSTNPGIVNLNIKNCDNAPTKSIFPHKSAYMTLEIGFDDPNSK